MFKSKVLILCMLVLLGGCAGKQAVRSEVKQVLKDNPELVLEVLEENNVELLEIVERGIDKRERQKREARFKKELDNPYSPSIDMNRPMLGNPDAPVTVVEYSDFLCPYCGKASSMINNLVQSNPDKYRLFFKHLPLHKDSRKLALIYEALASIDHEKARHFKNYVFANQEEFTGKNKDMALSMAVTETGVDAKALDKALKSEKIRQTIFNDIQEAKKFGLDATPSFMVNGVTIRGYVPEAQFKKTVSIIREKGKKIVDEGEVCEDCLNEM